MLICPCCNRHIREPTYDMEGAKCPKCGWSIYTNKNERINIMEKIILTDSEKANLEAYIDFIATSDDPCKACGSIFRREYCIPICSRKNAYKNTSNSFNVDELLSNKNIKEYVDARVKLKKCYKELKDIAKVVGTLKKTIGTLEETIDALGPSIGMDVETKIDTSKFYCTECKLLFKVPTNKCKNGYTNEGRKKYYPCPKCTKICWGKTNDEGEKYEQR